MDTLREQLEAEVERLRERSRVLRGESDHREAKPLRKLIAERAAALDEIADRLEAIARSAPADTQEER